MTINEALLLYQNTNFAAKLNNKVMFSFDYFGIEKICVVNIEKNKVENIIDADRDYIKKIKRGENDDWDIIK